MKRLCAIVLLATILMTSCAKFDEYDVGMELLTMELNSPQHWGYEFERVAEDYFRRVSVNSTYIPSLKLWESQGVAEYPLIYRDAQTTERILNELKDVEGMVKRSTVSEINYTPGITFLKYMKNSNFVSSHYDLPGMGLTAELRYDLPEYIDEILGTDLGMKIIIQRHSLEQFINYDRYSGIYMRYAVAVTKPKGYIEKKKS